MAFLDDLTTLETRETELVNNKVSRFAYTAEAYANNDASGVETYDPEADNNIPIAVASVLRVNDTIIDKGWRAQASSLTRMLMNHFLGRTSYNLNKVNDNFKDFLTSLKGSLGTANGIATLNADGKLNLSQFTPMTEITWDSLKSLRDDRELVAGHYYRITDYVTTTVQADTQSAGHQFDIIVRADSASVLNENAFAIQHEGDTYFASSNLSAWKLKYCLDNDTTRFAWADTTNGKGVIYRMVDEFENDLPYDFKNIQFKRFKANGHIYRSSISNARYNDISAKMKSFLNNGTINTNSLSYYYQYVNTASISGTWYDEDGNSVDGATLGTVNNFLYEPPKIVLGVTSDFKWFYTFSYMSGVDAEPADATISYNTVYANKFGIYKNSNTLSLNNNVFIGINFFQNTVGNNFNRNTVGNDFYNNTVGNDFYNNTVGNYFNSNTVGNNFFQNTVRNNFNRNTVGNDFNSNTVGNSFNNNTVGNSFNYNTVGNDFYNNTVGNYFNRNTVGNNFFQNTVGNSFYQNTVGNDFYNNTVENGFSQNTVGNSFNNNTVGNSFYQNTVGNNFNRNTVGNSFYQNTVGNNFNYNTVGNGFNNNTVGDYYKWIHAEDGCQNLNFSTNGTASSYVQKYRVLAGTAPSSMQTVSVTAGNTIPYNIKQTGARTIDVVAV